MDQPLHITSRDNPLLVKLRRLLRDGASYRKAGEVWLEGDHLCRAAVQRGRSVAQAVLDEPAWQDAELSRLAQAAARVVVLPQALFRELSTLESPAHIGFLMPLEAAPSQTHGMVTRLALELSGRELPFRREDLHRASGAGTPALSCATSASAPPR